jgi:hypothetical protein
VIGSVKLSLIISPKTIRPSSIENAQALEFVEEAAVAERFVDLDKLLEIAASAEDFPFRAASELSDCRQRPSSAGLRRILILRSIHYPENLGTLE